MDEDAEITLIEEAESSNPQTDQNPTNAGYTDNTELASIEITRVTQDGDSEKEQEDEMAEIIMNTNKKSKEGAGHMDKFKRRLIRAIANYIRNDQIPPDEIWVELQKQSGCDCKLLWDRMRVLTTKKIQRLFTAEDVVDNITQIARLNVTDWLLFDLVLVHEKLDVIGEDVMDPYSRESPKILEDLFATVVIYNLENLVGDELTKAWFEATRHYNGKVRQSSPMLLQRRWYQMKTRVRDKFYQFWFSYRGDQRQLAAANEFRPTDLEMEIVKHFKYITTKAFPSWEELIEQKKVALPEDFERLKLAKRRIFRTETGPDLELIEPQIETIDLGQESDSEESRDSTAVSELQQNVNLEIVKTEKIDVMSDDDDVHVLESVHIPLQNNDNAGKEKNVEDAIVNIFEEEIDDIDIEGEHSSNVNEDHNLINPKELPSVSDKDGNILANSQSNDFTDQKAVVEDHADTGILMPTIVASTSIANISIDLDDLPKITNVSSNADLSEESDTVNDVNGILESFAENMSAKKLYDFQFTAKSNITNEIQQDPETDLLVKNIIDEEINSKIKETAADSGKKLDCFSAVPNDMFDGIELEDDGIEYIEEDDPVILLQPKTEIKIEKTDDLDSVNTQTIDLKLLLTPVVYTKKLDDMDVFRFIEYNSVRDKRIIENAGYESKPVDRNSVKMEEISQERQPMLDGEPFSDTASEYYSEEVGPETVSLSSWLLNKPRISSYNPIQLCKNPDFNTRLKRLSAGFFSSERNRHLLKECKPLTIDIHKSFETKLHNNTLYLKGTKSIGYKTGGLETNATEETILPSALPIENLKNNLINDFLGPLSGDSSATQSASHQGLTDSHLVERKKVNLPDIAQIRRLNERLLTAEVSPIQALNSVKPPVNIVTMQQNNDILQNNTIDANANKGVDLTVSSTFASNKSNIIANIPDKNNVTFDITSEVQQIKSSKIPAEVVKQSENCSNLSFSSSGSVNNSHKTKSSESVLMRDRLTKRSTSQNPHSSIQKKNGKEPKKPVRVNHIPVPWLSRSNTRPIPDDVLLTSDTVDKILNVCRGDEVTAPKLKQLNKALREHSLKENRKDELATNKRTNQGKKDAVGSEPLVSEQASTPTSKELVPQPTVKKKSKMERTLEYIRKEKNIYCCWAREKIFKMGTKKRVTNKHICPRPLCHCCCRQELVEKMFEAKRGCKAQPSTKQIAAPIIKVTSAPSRYDKPTEMSHKVSVGINTDFDPEFEKGFAANLEKFKSSSKTFDRDNYLASNIQVRYPPNIYHANGQTQTTVNLRGLDNLNINSDQIVSIESDSSNEGNTFIPIKIPALNKYNANFSFNEGTAFNVKQINNHNYPTSKASNPNIVQLKKNAEVKKPITSTISTENDYKKKLTLQNNPILKGHPYTIISKTRAIVPEDLSQVKSTSQTPVISPFNSNNSIITLQKKGKKSDKVLFVDNKRKQKPFLRTPICLGRNKILLCSFDTPHLINQLKGDTVTTNSNHDMNQNNNNFSQNTLQSTVTLPEGVRIVLLPNKELAVSIDPGIELDQSQLAYLPTLMATIQQQLAAADAATSSVFSPINQISTSKDKNNITLNSCNEKEKILDGEKKDDTVSLVCNEKLRDISDDIMEVNDDQTKVVSDVMKKSVLDESNNLADLKDSTDSNKKTILSDLMEMSGISAEDSHSANNLSPSKQQSELVPTPIIQGLKFQITNQHNEKYVNNPLFTNPAVQTALSRCPELCIVFSYQELRYASENNAQFYKMDIETGVVVPINLVIRKQVQVKPNKQNEIKAVIDLTDDPEENESFHIEEQNATTLETHPAVEKEKAPVPVKLFSTVNPSTLQGGRSLLLQSAPKSLPTILLKKKKMIRLIRKKKPSVKPLTESITSIDLDSDTEHKEEASVNVTPVAKEKTKCDEDSDSDDEPLALKSKRMKVSSETTEPANQITDKVGQEHNNLDDDNNQNTEMPMEIEVPESVTENPTLDDTFINTPEAEREAGVNFTPHLEPVVFDPITLGANAAESSGEDCILGV